MGFEVFVKLELKVLSPYGCPYIHNLNYLLCPLNGDIWCYQQLSFLYLCKSNLLWLWVLKPLLSLNKKACLPRVVKYVHDFNYLSCPLNGDIWCSEQLSFCFCVRVICRDYGFWSLCQAWIKRLVSLGYTFMTWIIFRVP